MNTPGLRQVREKVRSLLQDAEQEKGTSLQDAMGTLKEAAQLLPQLAVEKGKGSARNLTEDRNTNEISYMSKRGNILYELKDYEEAQKCYEFIKKKLPNNTGVYKALGDCLRKLKKFQDASEMYNRGLVVYEKDDLVAPSVKAGLLNSRGLNYMEQGKLVEAKNDFEAAVKITAKNPNPLYLYNKGYALYALNEKDEALRLFEEANELAKSGKTNGLTEQNLEYIKNTFERLVKGLKNLKTVELKKLDQGIHARELGYIKANFDAIDLTEVEEQGEKVPGQEGVSIIMAAKLDVKRIQQDQPLFEYYDGFLFALSKSYNTAVIINSGQELFHTNREIDTLSSAIQLMPLVGPQLCDGLEDLAKYTKSAEVMKAAANISKFATSQNLFLGIVQDALVEAIDAKQEEIRAQKEIDLEKIILPRLASKYQKIINRINKLNGNGSEMLYGERNETPLQRLGYMTANTLMSEYVASGAIYNGELAIRVSKDERKKRLAQIAKELFDKSLDRTQLTQLIELSGDTEQRGTCNSCQGCRMF